MSKIIKKAKKKIINLVDKVVDVKPDAPTGPTAEEIAAEKAAANKAAADKAAAAKVASDAAAAKKAADKAAADKIVAEKAAADKAAADKIAADKAAADKVAANKAELGRVNAANADTDAGASAEITSVGNEEAIANKKKGRKPLIKTAPKGVLGDPVVYKPTLLG